MDKAPDAFRTISEVADDLDIPQHVLRFWETRFTQIKPMKRSGGRRYYRPDDIDLLRGIRRLQLPRSVQSKRWSDEALSNGITTTRPASTLTTMIMRAPTASIFVCSKPMRTESRRPWMPARSPASPLQRARLTSHA